MLFDWKIIVASLIVVLLIIVNFLATNNIAGTFKSKQHIEVIFLINVMGGLSAIILLIPIISEVFRLSFKLIRS